ncbi:zinc finger CCCH-type antiviral protein 1-like [Penaeus chinensis]|uniref:zinc finger CCCH-type antiviral protein 1-like n=1 Tax=Penaeus chinensis TaxID=139456 RepID=UPI001FB58590|nr:zinc finger CCCH-type antiviral protein 1-like [Penaeus chinensis]
MATARRRVPCNDAEPQKFSQGELNDLVRALSLSKDKADLLISRLKEKGLLMKDGNVVLSATCQGSHQIPEICYKSVSGTCAVAGCSRLHSKIHFHWQVTKDCDTWYNFPEKTVHFLEQHFCNPESNFIILQRLDDSCHDRGLLSLLKCHNWDIGFKYTQWDNNCAYIPIFYQDMKYHIRRLCTERNPTKNLRANRFIWYYQDDLQNWCPFDFPNNKSLEDAYEETPKGNVIIQTGVAKYRVDFSKMNQENVSTKKIRDIRRRPLPLM